METKINGWVLFCDLSKVVRRVQSVDHIFVGSISGLSFLLCCCID